MRRGPLFWLGALALLGGLALLVETWIVTDREAIRALVQAATEAVKAGDFDAFAETLDPAYQAEDRDRDQVVEYVRTLWRRYRPLGLELELGEIEVDGDDASGPGEVQGNVLGRPMRIPVQVTFRRTDDGWRIAGAHPTGWPG